MNPPPSAYRITPRQVHVWSIALDRVSPPPAELRELLTIDELGRAGRLRFTRDRDRFIAARAGLRRILGRYLDMRPRAVRFSYSPEGKPQLAAPVGEESLRFNLSHSGSRALCAVTRNQEVGVDIERVRPDFAFAEIVDQFFTPAEIRAIERAPAGDRVALFFRYWVRKEAYLKAIGKGLSGPLTRVDVSRQVGPAWSPVERLDPRPGGVEWYGRDLPVAPGFTAAVVVEGLPVELLYREHT